MMEFEAIGTTWRITLPQEISDSQESDIFDHIRARIAVFDQHYSRFREDSLVSEMARTPGVYTLPDDAKPLFDLYEQLYKLTDGRVTPLIGTMISQAGYDAQYSLVPKKMTRVPTWEEAVRYVYPTFELTQPVLLDVGAAGKGYLVDLVGELLRAKGIHQFTIDAGGDIVHADPEERIIRIGLEHPDDPTSVIGVVEIENESICGSAGNRRKWGDFHHIMNPFTQSSPKHIAAVWVIANTGLLADALTTALFFSEPEALAPLGGFDYVILYSDATLRTSPGIRAEWFI